MGWHTLFLLVSLAIHQSHRSQVCILDWTLIVLHKFIHALHVLEDVGKECWFYDVFEEEWLVWVIVRSRNHNESIDMTLLHGFQNLRIAL